MSRRDFWRCLQSLIPGLMLFWLASCTLGLGTVASGIVNLAARPLTPEPLDYLPHPSLKQWAARPGPPLEVKSVPGISSQLFIRDDELPKGGAQKAPRPGNNMKGRAGDFMGMVSGLLAISDIATRDVLLGNWKDDELLDEVPGAVEDQRRQLALNEFPFVLLQGEELLHISGKGEFWPQLARASSHSKVTVITSDGTFIGIAQRIHFRSGTSEVILEGDPTVQSGQQHIKGTKPGAVMRLDFKKRLVLVNGPVVQKKLFQ